MEFVNIWYGYDHPDFKAAFRCDYEKYEESGKLAIEKREDKMNPEEFIPCEMSYKQMRELMLKKKFETIFNDKAMAAQVGDDGEDPAELIRKLVEKEDNRKNKIKSPDSFNSKGLSQTYEEKNTIKMMKGPFYKLLSQTGLEEDDFLTCAQQDLIDYVNKPAPRVLILGKPRSGKTTLAAELCKRHDLVHVSVENWMEELQNKIRELPEEFDADGHDNTRPEDPESDEYKEWVPRPDYFTDVELRVKKRLLRGKGPTHLHNVAMLKEQMNSAEAKTKGFVLDLTFYKINVEEEETEEEIPEPEIPQLDDADKGS